MFIFLFDFLNKNVILKGASIDAIQPVKTCNWHITLNSPNKGHKSKFSREIVEFNGSQIVDFYCIFVTNFCAACAGGLSESSELSMSSRGSATPCVEQTTCQVESIITTSIVDSVKSAAKSKVPSDVKRQTKQLGRDVLESEKRDRTASVKQMFSSFLSGTGSTTVQMPFPADEHHLLPACQKVPVVVYDQEPSSVIAYALSSQDYELSLQQLRVQISADLAGGAQKPSTRPPASTSSATATPIQTTAGVDAAESLGKKSVLSFLKGSSSSRDHSPGRNGRPQRYEVDMVKYTPRLVERDNLEDSDEIVDSSQAKTDSQKVSSKSTQQQQQPVNHHIELQFIDNTAKFYCRVCFADQFVKLRKLIFPDGEERYIRSLSRCFTWLARGGKSGSSFCKTQDDRFILKQMSRYEVQSFNEFAPRYFGYITSAHTNNKPTALAKIVGVYKIGYQNSKTGTAMKQDLLVMENLFYDRKVTQIFDLKGSVRNRLVSTSGKRVEDLVLLDENLLKVSVDSPLYVYPHSKAVLTSAITHDTQFLANHSVMDYSLLVGCDESTNELVIGIIDYIRTFTWDKMLEMVLKKNIIGAMPTVVSPELYRRRFLESMDRYFLYVPDRWTGYGRGMSS